MQCQAYRAQIALEAEQSALLDLLVHLIELLEAWRQIARHAEPIRRIIEVLCLLPEIGCVNVGLHADYGQKARGRSVVCRSLGLRSDHLVQPVRVLDVPQHHIALMQTILAKSALHQLQITQFIRVACVRFRENSLVKHLLVHFEELFLAAVDVDQCGDDVVLAALRGDELYGLTL